MEKNGITAVLFFASVGLILWGSYKMIIAPDIENECVDTGFVIVNPILDNSKIYDCGVPE